MSEELLQKVQENIGFINYVEFEGGSYQILAVMPKSPPLEAYWWHGKQVHVIAVDVDGNLFLRHCDGSVRYWSHSEKKDIVAFRSLKEFTAAFRES